MKTTRNERDSDALQSIHGTREAKLTALMRRESAVKAALEALRAEKRKQRGLDRETSARIHTLVGAAVAADLETAGDEAPRRRAYISEVLNRYYAKKSGARALLENNGWL